MKILIILLLLIPFVYAQCEGCEYNDKCVKVGTQRLTSEYGEQIYCSSNRKIETAKNDGDPCLFDYECKSYLCDNECQTIKQKRDFNFIFVLYGLIGVLLILVAVSLINSFKYKKKKKTQKVEKKPLKVVLGTKRKSKSYDTLDSNIQSSIERLSSLFKKK
ncbi:MAG: hypothetical protein QGF74_02605 [Candidatus Nanoarchaeia archaeon]|jgi:hypothetical protein|nr:hypothetical protein [Candidatus Nanoarchaeia archaeon]|tara:strand:+ start:1719 stop:2201 length:483 start_codon:yes stop_codon:yes gene_type:complete